MKVLEDRDDGLHAVLAQQQAGYRLISVPLMLLRVERVERMVVRRSDVEKIKHRQDGVL